VGKLFLTGASEVEDIDAHEEENRGIGRLVRAMWQLEFMLRAFLYERELPKIGRFATRENFIKSPVGTKLPVNAITDYSSLDQLIRRYNAIVRPASQHLTIDDSVVGIRDALAHGRVVAVGQSEAAELVKYSKPQDAEVFVAYRMTMTPETLRRHGKHVQDQMLIIARALRELPT